MFIAGVLAVAISFSLGWYVRGSDNFADARLHELYRMNDSLKSIVEKMPTPPEPPENMVKKEDLTSVCFALIWGSKDPNMDLDKPTYHGEVGNGKIARNVIEAMKYCSKFFPHIYGN